jgi:hypothetical protein
MKGDTLAALTLSAASALVSAPAWAEAATLPLPPAPVQLLIPDATAFDAALAGPFRLALTGEPASGDPVVKAWRQTPVGSKLEDQWRHLSFDLPWTWTQIRQLRPRAVGLALLDAGALEAVLIVDTPLAALPLALPAGGAGLHRGVAYRLVERGAGDDQPGDRRMGVAWTRLGSLLVVATSERALRLSIDESLAGRGADATLPGLASLRLDVTALRRDLYFRREFLFADDARDGIVVAALRLEGDSLVEVREGRGTPGPDAWSFAAPGDIEAAWEPEASGLWPTLRAGLLEPLPRLEDRPVTAAAPLPPVAGRDHDAYLTDLRRPLPTPGTTGEEGELALWKALASRAPAGFGHAVAADGARRLVFEWPKEHDAELVALCRATLERRAGRVAVVAAPGGAEFRVGPGLPALAVRRTGRFLWMGPDAAALAGVSEPTPDAGVARWAHLDLGAARSEALRWERIEGPGAPERVRPLSDRLLGLLGWMPRVSRLALERRQTGESWSERLVFESTAP